MNLQSIPDQLRRMTSGMSLAQKASIPVAAVLVTAGLLMFSRWRYTQDFKPLFTGMSAEDAGSVVQKLKEAGTEYRVAENGSVVLVPSASVSESRLMLATAGLPKSGRIGFELFDKTNLSTTDFAEQVNFRRALEGELERTIRSVTEVQEARVHLTFPKDSVFVESRQPAKASVLLRLRPGARITPANAVAITHLVASAVDGLAPDDVSVMDVDGNLLSRKKSSPDVAEASDELIEYRQKLERDLLEKANATLEPLLGSGRYRIGLSVDCDFSSGEQSDEVYDPEKSVMVTSQKSEETNTAATAGGVPGTASNLPRPAPRTVGSGTSVSRRTENISYQSSRTIRKVRLPQGSIRRISASVLLDQANRWEKQQGQYRRIFEPPSAENLRAIKDLVSAAIGLVPSRGDQIVIESLPFEATRQAPPPGAAPPAAAPAAQPPMHRDWRLWAAVGGGVLLVAALGFALTRSRRSAKRPRVGVTSAPGIAAAPPAQSLPAPEPSPAMAAAAEATRMISEAQGAIVQTGRIEVLIEQLRKGVSEDPSLAASVLRTWLAEGRTR